MRVLILLFLFSCSNIPKQGSEKACANKSKKDCLRIAAVSFFHKDYDRSRKFFINSCLLGEKEACKLAGFLNYEMEEDDFKTLVHRGCQKEKPYMCVIQGINSNKNKRYMSAKNAWIKACKVDPFFCHYAAEHFILRQDRENTLKTSTYGCSAKYTRSCEISKYLPPAYIQIPFEELE